MPGPQPGTLIQYFKDDATAFNNKKHAILDGKGVLNNRISEYIMQCLSQIGVPNHFIRRLNMREQLVYDVEIIPLEVVVRNIAAGSLSKRLGIKEGTRLPNAIIEFYYKNDSLGDPLVVDDHITTFGWASPQEIDDMIALATRINDFLGGLFLGAGIQLVDFKLEFGRLWEKESMRIVIADEISPDSCRLWDCNNGKKLDKDRFRCDLGAVTDAYREVAHRLGVLRKDEAEREKEKVQVKLQVMVTLKPDLFDPQGAATKRALVRMGYHCIQDLRQGKIIEVTMEQTDPQKARAQLDMMCQKLLVNPVSENYAIATDE